MKDSLRSSKASLSSVFSLVVFLFLLNTLPLTLKAQFYLDMPLQMDFYRTNSTEIDFSRRGVIVNPTFGFTINNNATSKIDLSIGLGFFYSKFQQEIADSEFEYNRYGLLLSLQAYYDLSDKIKVGLGISQGLHSTQLGDPLKLDVYSGSERDDRLGKGFRPYNVGNSIEVRYEIYNNISIGSNYTYWYIPQLKYRVIGNYGEFLEDQSDLYFSRFEISVRVDFNR
jgi:hypothetical protein